MFENISKFFRELDRRIKVLYAFMGINLWHHDLTLQYNNLYVTGLGANPVELGTLNSISRLTGSVMSIPSGWIADRYGVKKVLLIGLGLTIIVSAIYGIAGNWLILIPAILLSGAVMRLVMPYVDILFINLAKPEQRAMVLSLARTFWAVLRIFAPMVAAIIVAHFGGLNAEGIRPLYYLQLVLAILVFISIVIWLKAPKDNPVEQSMEPGRKKNTFIQDFREVFKSERWVKRWIIIFTTQIICMNLTMPFVPLWLVDVKGADPYILGIMGVAGMTTSVLLQTSAGRLADKIGRKKAFYLFRPFAYIGTLLLVMAPSAEYLILVGILGCIGLGGIEGGGLYGVSFIPYIAMNFEMVSQEKRGRWLGILGTFGIISFPASILGGIMWQQGLMIEVLLIPILLEVLILIPTMSTIPETLRKSI